MVVNEELGRGLVNAPLCAGRAGRADVALGRAADVQAQWLPKIADASALVVLAHQGTRARYRLNHVARQGGTRAGDGWTLTRRQERGARRRRGRCLHRAGTAGADTTTQSASPFLVAAKPAVRR